SHVRTRTDAVVSDDAEGQEKPEDKKAEPPFCKTRAGIHPDLLTRVFLDIGKRPVFLLEKFRLRSVETEHEFKFAGRVGWNPVCFLTGRRFRTDIEIDRSVGVL